MNRILVVFAVTACVLELSSCWISEEPARQTDDWAGPENLAGGSSIATAPLINLDTWYADYISTGETLWFEVNDSQLKTYHIFWDDAVQGSGLYTADITVSATSTDENSSYTGTLNNGYDDPLHVTPWESTFYLKVYGSTDGTFAIGAEESQIGD